MTSLALVASSRSIAAALPRFALLAALALLGFYFAAAGDGSIDPASSGRRLEAKAAVRQRWKSGATLVFHGLPRLQPTRCTALQASPVACRRDISFYILGMTSRDEEAFLKKSIAMTVVVGASGVSFGVLSGSLSIAFDGLFSAVDAAMTGLALLVTRLIARDASRRFQMGFWHLEPMVLAFNGALLTLLSVYALVNAVGTLLDGGRELVFDWAIGYAVLVVAICIAMVLYGRHANRTIGSQFVTLDIKGWTMSGAITAALLVAFTAAYWLEGTRHAWMTPYVDPFVLAVLTICLIPMPLRTVISALKDVFLVAPADLDQQVRAVADAIVARHAFLGARTYVAKAGRSRLIEVHFIVPQTFAIDRVSALDAIREEVGDAIGHAGNNRWLTIAFTGDVKWVQ